MTDAHEPNEIDGPHEGPIKTPRQLILAVLYAFLVPIFGIVLLVMYVTTADRPAAGSDALTPQATAARIQPVGRVEVKDPNDIAAAKTGEQVFAGQCTTCHTPGLLGAPKFGDTAAWTPRIQTGFDALLHSALTGKGSMPAQGGGDFSDFEIARAVTYMADKGGASFPEPTAPPAPASGAALASAAPAPAVAVPNAAALIAAANAGATKTDANAPPPLFAQICTACHTAGVAGAPKLGDKTAWAPRIAQGIDALTASAIKGKGAMPPKGGSTASDTDIKAVVTYMVNAAK
jgi:cytochrome c5